MSKIWIVGYWDSDIEPVITVFGNKEAALKYHEWLTKASNDGKEYKTFLNESVVFQFFKEYN